MSQIPLHDRPLPRKVLAFLAGQDQEPTKSELATGVYGRSDSSTRALIARLTAVMIDAGLIDERVIGRERRVRLTPLGQARLTVKPAAAVAEWLDVDAPPDHPQAQPADRPRFHLRHAALLSFAAVRQRTGSSGQRDADDHFKQLLWSIICEDTPPADDLQRFYQLARSWPVSDPRLLLAECIVRFQNETTRSSTLEDLLIVGDDLQPDADAVLWATASIIVAHHHLVDPRVPSDGVTARGLLERALSLMGKAAADPRLTVAAGYRIALARSIREGAWSCELPAATAADVGLADPVTQQIVLSDKEVRSAAAANAILDPIEHLWARIVGPWLIRTLPTCEAIFRRVHHRDASREIHDWKLRTDGLVGLLRGLGKTDSKLQDVTLRFIEAATQMVRQGSRAACVLIPHINQGALLLDRDDLQLPDDVPERDYRSLVLNNLWTPEMVAADPPRA